MTNQPSLSEQRRRAAADIGRWLAEGVRHHQQGRLDRAAALYKRVLALDPRQSDALHLSGLIAHQRGRHAEALALIDQAIARDGRPPAYLNSAGSVLLALGRSSEAEARFRQAIARDPLYPDAHNNLGNALHSLGRFDEAIAAYDRAIETRPEYGEAWANRGRVLHLFDRPAEAVESLHRALALAPKWTKALRYLGDALGAAGDRAAAEEAYREAIAIDPRDPETQASLAALLERANQLDDALAAAQTALKIDARHARAAVTAARAQRRLGDPQAALARLEAIDAGADVETGAYAAFERGQILDRMGRYEPAYRAFVEGNALLSRTPAALAADRSLFPTLIGRLRSRFTTQWLESWSPDPPFAGRPPVFLVGFPRSGTTLLDQILDSHPALATMEEKPALDVVRHRIETRPEGYPEAMARLSANDIVELRALYLAEVGRYLGDLEGRTPVDKMPLNAVDAGLIYRLFPQAPILLALRHPCDVVLSGFMQAMKPNAAMVLLDELGSTAHFYADVMGMWLQYQNVLPLRLLAVRYEDLVQDFSGEVRRILAFLGLPWDDAVLGYAERAKTKAIATPSYHQVVQPIYRRSVGRWRNYGAHLAGALPVLKPLAEAFGYSLDEA